MKKSEQGNNESCNYRVNGAVMSFKSKEDFAKNLEFKIKHDDGPLTVEPLDSDESYYDHMQEVVDMGYSIVSITRGAIAIAYAIQEDGHFLNYSPCDISQCLTSCSKLISEIHDILDASDGVYEEQWKIQAERARRAQSIATREQ